MKKIVMIICTALLLSSCEVKITDDYLMQHPDVLQQQFNQCQTKELPQCEMVKRAFHDFSQLVTELSNNPELFGLKIMHLQQVLSAENDQKKVSKLRDAQYQQLGILYAVVNMIYASQM